MREIFKFVGESVDPSKTYSNRLKRQKLRREVLVNKKADVYHSCSDPFVFDPKCRACVNLSRLWRGLAQL